MWLNMGDFFKEQNIILNNDTGQLNEIDIKSVSLVFLYIIFQYYILIKRSVNELQTIVHS